VPPGGTVTLVIDNRRFDWLEHDLVYTLEHWDGAAWSAVPAAGWEEIETPLVLEARETSRPQVIDAPAGDGWYRVTKTVVWPWEDSPGSADLHARFEVASSELEPAPDEDFVVLAANAAERAGFRGAVAMDRAELAAAWEEAGALGGPPSIPDGFGVLVVTVPSSTCRSPDDVLGVEVDGDTAVVVLDAEGEFTRPCPGPSDVPRATVFAVAIPAEQAGGVEHVGTRT
jgi:hypothetical protein